MAEGVIKFKMRHVFGPLPENAQIKNLMFLRDELHAKKLIGCDEHGTGYGNVSIRYENDTFIISGSGTGAYSSLGREDYCLIEACNPSSNLVFSRGKLRPSSESLTHYAVYRARKDIACVIHVHSKVLFDKFLSSGEPTTPPAIKYGTVEMAEAISSIVFKASSGIIVMCGHEPGLLAYGPDCGRAKSLLFGE